MVQSDDEYREMYRRLYREFLPEVQAEFNDKQTRKNRRRASVAEYGKRAAANAVGTFVGGLALIVAGSLAGLLTELSAAALIVIVILIATATGTLVLIIHDAPKTPEDEAHRRAARLTALQIQVDVIGMGAEYRAERKRAKQRDRREQSGPADPPV